MEGSSARIESRKRLINLFSARPIEELFPDEAWDCYPQEALFAASFKAALKFIQFGDPQSAEELLQNIGFSDSSRRKNIILLLNEHFEKNGDDGLGEFFCSRFLHLPAGEYFFEVLSTHLSSGDLSGAALFTHVSIAQSIFKDIDQLLFCRRQHSFNKVVGIGLQKTGTSSLSWALDLLGVRCLHAPLEYRKAAREADGEFPEALLSTYDAFCDDPFFFIYKELDRKYPGSKFIWTVRELGPWLESIRKHVERNRNNPNYEGPWLEYDEKRETERYQRHAEEVREYFKNREDDIAVVDITAGDGWDKICPLLGINVPRIEFPHKNKHKDSSTVLRTFKNNT